jgi:hypothetical protein
MENRAQKNSKNAQPRAGDETRSMLRKAANRKPNEDAQSWRSQETLSNCLEENIS